MESINNDLVKGGSGRIGDMLVFRQRGGKTFIAKRPIRKSDQVSEKQLNVRERFIEAVIYAKAVVNDEAKKAIYQLKANASQSAYNLALSDFCKAPQIKRVAIDEYQGRPGDKILIRATDDFMVNAVQVRIIGADNAEIETGQAVLSDNGLDWVYTAKVLSSDAVSVFVSVFDLPGNTTAREVEL